MKNLLIHISFDKQFSPEYEALTKIQIDNSLALGWNPSDILLVTNFNYQYRGIKSLMVDNFLLPDQRTTKIPVILELFDRGLIGDDLYWFHDHDAFQLTPFTINFNQDAAFTDHGAHSSQWNAGSFFFKKEARDIFVQIYDYMKEKTVTEQEALTYLWQNNVNNINKRYTLLDPSYNIGIYKIKENIALSQLPIKVVHFHPHKPKHLDLFKNYIPKRLMNIFNQYGIK